MLLEKIPLFGVDKEKKTLSKIIEHIEIACRIVMVLDEAFKAIEEGDTGSFKDKQKEIKRLEKMADSLRRETEENIYSGAFLPISRSRILDFAEQVDNIADTVEDASKILIYLNRDDIPKELLGLLRKEVYKSYRCVELLKCGVENIEDLDKVRKIVEEIRLKEHETDEINKQAFDLLYAEEYSAKVLHLLTKLVEFVSDISDKAEDASDSLGLIVLMHKI